MSAQEHIEPIPNYEEIDESELKQVSHYKKIMHFILTIAVDHLWSTNRSTRESNHAYLQF
jgi:hypothetical protein